MMGDPTTRLPAWQDLGTSGSGSKSGRSWSC